MKNRKPVVVTCLVFMALLLVVLPVLSSCGPAAEPVKVLKVGITTPSTGPAAEKGRPLAHGNLDAIEYINNELGGVNGYPIEAVWLDNGYDAAKVVTNVKKFQDEGCLMFTTVSSKMMSAAMELANRNELPGLACFTSPILYRPPEHIYGQMPDYGDDALAFANYYLENIWEGEGKPRFALHLLNNSTGSGARDAYRAKAEELGIEIVAIEEHTTTTTSEMESLVRIREQNPDVLFISSTPAPTALIIKNAYEMDMYPGITIGCAHAGFTKVLIDIAGADVVEGVYGTFPTVLWGEDVPGMAKVVEYCERLHPDDAGNMDYIIAWAQSLIIAEILRTALESVDYETLAKGDLAARQALETQGIKKLKDYAVDGLQGPVSYTPGDNRLTKYNRIYQIADGEITNPSPWVEAPLIKYEDYEWFDAG